MVARLRRDRAVPIVLAAALLVSAGPRAQQPAPAGTGVAQQPVFRGGANFVLVDAYPQKDGKIVEGLTATDFQVLEDGKPQTIEGLEFVRVEPNQPESTRRDPNNLNEMKQQASDPHNRVFVAFLDLGHITTSGSYYVRRPLVDTLNRIVGPSDLFGVTTANQRAKDITLGRRLESVEEQLSKYWYWGAKDRTSGDMSDPGDQDLIGCFHSKLVLVKGVPTFVPWLVDDGARRRYMDEILMERRHEDRALQALRDLVVYLPTIREARTMMLVISNGWLLFRPNPILQTELGSDERMKALTPPAPGATPVGGPGTNMTFGNIKAKVTEVEWGSCVTELNRLALLEDRSRFNDLLDLAARNNVSFFPVAADGLVPLDIGSASDSSSPNPRAKPGETILGENFARLGAREASLREAAENTDGIAIVNTNDLAAGLRKIVDDVSAYYLLGYYSTNPKFDGKYRKIEVKSTKPGVNVRARRGYTAPTPAPASGPAASAAVAVDPALASLARLTTAAELFVTGAAADGRVTASVELPDRAMLDPAWSRGADITVDLTDDRGASQGSATGRIEAGARGALIPIETRGGIGPFHLVARAKSGTSSVDGRGEVASASGTLVGAAVLYRATPSPRSPLRPVADFLFRRNERLHVEWPVRGALDQRLVRVLDRRGLPLPLAATLTEREVDGAPAIAVDLNLAPLAEGDYVLDLETGRGSTKEHALVAFRVVR